MPNIQERSLDGGAAPRFLVAVWIGAGPPPGIVSMLERAGIGVMLSRNVTRASALLEHFRPSALLSGSLEDLLAFADGATPLILVNGSPRAGSLPAQVVQVTPSTPDAVAAAVHLQVRTRAERLDDGRVASAATAVG